MCFFAPRQPVVAKRLFVHRRKPHRRAVFRRHVGQRGAVGKTHGGVAFPEVLHKLADDAPRPEDFGDRQYQVGCGDSLAQPAGQPEADHVRHHHVNRLAQHHRLRLDAPDAPADHAQTVDHGGVAIGPHEAVQVGDEHTVFFLHEHAPGEILQIHLVNDSGRGRDHAEILECPLTPLEELVAFPISLEFPVDVFGQRIGRPVIVDLDGMVDHQIARHHRIDLAVILTHAKHRRPHRRQVDHRRHAGEILQ